jgi:hypothetical protein
VPFVASRAGQVTPQAELPTPAVTGHLPIEIEGMLAGPARRNDRAAVGGGGHRIALS